MSQKNVLSKKTQMIYRLNFNAVFIALYVVFASFLTIKTPITQVSLASVPVICCAVMFGPMDGFAVAFVGSFIEQVLYGLSATTLLWMAPPCIQGLAVGLIVMLLKYKPNKLQLILTVVFTELLLTAANTAALYLDGYIWQYPVKALHLILPTRLLSALFRTIVSTLLVLYVIDPLKKIVTQNGRKTADIDLKED